jgi:hypothetical protein
LLGLVILLEAPRARNPGEQMLSGAMLLLAGALIAIAGISAGKQKQAVACAVRERLARQGRIDLRQVALEAQVSVPLADRYIRQMQSDGALPLNPDIDSPLHTAPTEDAAWRHIDAAREAGTLLETLLSLRASRPVSLQAFAAASRKRSPYWTAFLVLALFVLFFPAFLLVAILALPGLLYFTWTYFSRCDENEAFGARTTGGYVALCVFAILAGVGLLMRLSRMRQYALIRTSEGTGLVSIPVAMDGLGLPIREEYLQVEPVWLEEVSRTSGNLRVRVQTAAASDEMIIRFRGRLAPYSAAEENLEVLLHGRPAETADAAQSKAKATHS